MSLYKWFKVIKGDKFTIVKNKPIGPEYTIIHGTYTIYAMGCPPIPEDNPQALVSGLSYVQADNPRNNYFIPPTSL